MACSGLSAPNHPRVVRQTIQCETGISGTAATQSGREAAHILLRDGGPRLSPGTRRSCTEYLGLPKVMPSLPFFFFPLDTTSTTLRGPRVPISGTTHTHALEWFTRRTAHCLNPLPIRGQPATTPFSRRFSRVPASIMTPCKDGPSKASLTIPKERKGGGGWGQRREAGGGEHTKGHLLTVWCAWQTTSTTNNRLLGIVSKPPHRQPSRSDAGASIVCLFGLARGGLAHVSVRSSYGRNLGNDRPIWLTSCLFFQRGPAVWLRRPCDVMVWAGVMANSKNEPMGWAGFPIDDALVAERCYITLPP